MHTVRHQRETVSAISMKRVSAIAEMRTAPNAFVSLAEGDKASVRDILKVSQEQHRCIVEAIANREGARAGALTREHSRSAWKYLRLIFESGSAAAAPALSLIAR